MHILGRSSIIADWFTDPVRAIIETFGGLILAVIVIAPFMWVLRVSFSRWRKLRDRYPDDPVFRATGTRSTKEVLMRAGVPFNNIGYFFTFVMRQASDGTEFYGGPYFRRRIQLLWRLEYSRISSVQAKRGASIGRGVTANALVLTLDTVPSSDLELVLRRPRWLRSTDLSLEQLEGIAQNIRSALGPSQATVAS